MDETDLTLEDLRDRCARGEPVQVMAYRNYAEMLAARFHEIYEGLAPEHGWRSDGRPTAVPWRELPPENRSLMVASMEQLIQEFSLQ